MSLAIAGTPLPPATWGILRLVRVTRQMQCGEASDAPVSTELTQNLNKLSLLGGRRPWRRDRARPYEE